MNNTILLWNEEGNPASLTPFLLPGFKPRPAVLVIPGGGYGCVCEPSEGTPVALKFNSLGFHAFVLNYRVAPHSYPAPLEDAVRAVKVIRGNAGEWKVIPDRIISCGFSAGGHLAGAVGMMAKYAKAKAGDRYDSERGSVDAMILCYGVLMYAPWSHAGSWTNLSGGDEKIKELCSLEKQITAETPPAFVWATFTDQVVDYRNTFLFAQAMAAAKRPCELHIFNKGDHGMLLGLDTEAASWPTLAKKFFETQWELSESPEAAQRYTNHYQYMAEIREGLAKPQDK